MHGEILMTSTKPSSSLDETAGSRGSAPPEKPADQEPGTNAVQHEPDPKVEPIPDGEHKYIRRSPYTAGND